MAESQVTTSSVSALGGAAPWVYEGGVDEQPIDIWSRLRPAPVDTPPTIVIERPDRTEMSRVLAAWRASERSLEDHIETSPMRTLIRAEIDRLRARYQWLFTQAMR